MEEQLGIGYPRTKGENVKNAERMIDDICCLEEKAFEVLQEHPGSSKREFMENIMYFHWEEVVAVYGHDPKTICSSVLKLWDTPFYDTSSVQEHTFKEWAMIFSSEEAIDEFYKPYENE